MPDTTSPTYAAPDGTFLDVTAPPADAPEGAVVLSVSGHLIGVAGDTVVKVVDLLAEHQPGAGVTIWCEENDEDGPYLDVQVKDHGVEIGVRYDTTTDYRVTVPLDQAFMVACEIGIAADKER